MKSNSQNILIGEEKNKRFEDKNKKLCEYLFGDDISQHYQQRYFVDALDENDNWTVGEIFTTDNGEVVWQIFGSEYIDNKSYLNIKIAPFRTKSKGFTQK